MASLRVTEWSKSVRDLVPEDGDCIEFNRGIYSHWAIYIGDGQVMHFNPFDSAEKIGINRSLEFVPGCVTKELLTKVAGKSYIRVNNKPEIGKQPRCIDHMHGLRKILVDKPGFYYCLTYFNCEHFVTFVKYGDARSSQMDTIESILTGGLTKLSIGGMNREDLFNKLAYMQWRENTSASYNKRQPKRVLEEGLLEWERA